MIALVALAVVLFIAACVGWSRSEVVRANLNGVIAAKDAELAAKNKVGKWYEARVEELENETRQLAEQVVLAGSFPRPVAMPRDDRDDAIYASDATGLVVERLDPRDLAFGQ